MKKFLLLLTAVAAAQVPLRAQPPTITNQPASQDASPGANVAFAVGVSGAGPFTYQWLFNATNLPTAIITTVAGNGAGGPYGTFSGDGGAATNASLAEPSEMAVDASGDLFVADAYNNRIREVNASGIIATVAGSGSTGYGTGSFSGDGGPATSATLSQPFGVAVSPSGNLFIADYDNHRIREVNTNGTIATIAGNGSASFSGDGGPATNASLDHPPAVAVDASGNVFIADELNQRVRKVATNGIITTIAGNGTAGYSGDNGAATNAALNIPYGLAVDASGNVFIADELNQRIRIVSTNGIITTVAGNGATNFSGDGGAATNASLNGPSGVAVDAFGNLFIADSSNNRIREVFANGIIATVAGNGTTNYSGNGGAATNAGLNLPVDVAVDAAGNLFVSEYLGQRIRKVANTQGPVLTLNDVTSANAGNYQVVVTGSGGSVTSSVALLAVGTPMTRTWNGSVSSDWFNATNWTPTGVPGPFDTLNFSGGTINLTAPVTNFAQFNWSGGTLSGSALTLANSGALGITGSAVLSGTLVLNGLANISGSGQLTLNGGTIVGGAVVATNGALIVSSGTLDGVTLNGVLDVGNSINYASLTVLDGLTLANGTMLVGNPANGWIGGVGFTGSQTLGGSGTVIFGNASGYYYNSLRLNSGGTTLTIGAGITIGGQNGVLGPGGGYWGGPGNVTLINQGAISAGFNGGTIAINPQTFLNGGTLNASNATVDLGMTFTLANLGTFNRVGGTVNLTGTLLNTNTTLNLNDYGGSWVLAGGDIVGGTVVATNGALIVSSGTLDGVTLNGVLDVGNSINYASLTVLDGLTLANGTILVGNPANGWIGGVGFTGSQTLGGSGTVIFGNASGYYYNSLRLNSGGTTLTIGAGITIGGQNGVLGPGGGYWGGPGNVTLINQGAISAGFNGGTIAINPQTFLNGGTLNASNATVDLGMTFTLANLGTFNRVGGTVNLTGTLLNTNTTLNLNDYGGSWVLAGGDIVGGTVVATNGALIVSSGTLDGVTLNGVLDVGNSINYASLTVLDGLTLANGTILVGNPANGWIGGVGFTGSQTLGGSGTVIFGNASGYYYNSLRLNSGGTTLTIGAGITIGGQNGVLGPGGGYWGGPGNVTLINQGTISAGFNGGTIAINPQTFLNGGTLNASNTTVDLGMTFTLANLGTFNRVGGTVNLTGTLLNTNTTLNLNDYGGSWVLAGGDIVGGTVVATNGALIVSSGTLDGVTLNGVLDVGNSINYASLTVLDGLTLANGTILVGNPANGWIGGVGFTGSQTLGGSGTVIFGNASGYYYNSLRLNSGGTTLTIGAGITIGGQNGVLGPGGGYWGGPGNVTLINQGAISCDVSAGTLAINAQAFTNFNILDAESGAISINAAFAQIGGAWTFGLNGPGNYGQLLISGSAPVGGTLNVHLNNGYLPSVNTPFSLVTCGSESGAFAVTNLPLQGLFWNLQYGATNISLDPTNYIAPVVVVTSPTNGASFTAFTNIPVTATATDANAAITKVEFFQGAAKIGQANIAPYTIIWSNVLVGNYSLTAKATDAVGATTTSTNPVIIHFFQPPATNYIWIGGVSSDWFTPANWTPTGVPGSQDGAFITNGGNVVLSSSTTIASFNLSSGTLGGNGTLTPTNVFNWTGGAMGCPVTVPSYAVLNINGNVTLSNLLNNAGTVNWLAGNIAVQNSTFYGGAGLIVNSSGGAWNIECDQQMYDPNGYLGNPYFQSAGTVEKLAGANTTVIGIPFYTTGTANILAGMLNLTNGGTIEGGFNANTGTTISFSGGNFGIGGASGASFTAQQVLIGTNTLANGAVAVTVYTNAAFVVTNSTGTAYVDVGAGGTFTLDGGLLQVDSLLLTNGGAFTNLAGSLVCPQPYQLENGGSISIDGGSITTSTNFTLGTFGNSTGLLVVANGGTLDVLDSTLGIGDNGSLTNGSGLGIVTVSNGLVSAAAITLGSTAGGLGSLSVQSGGTVTVSSNLTAVSGSLSSTSIVSVVGGTLNVPNGTIAIGPSGAGLMTIDNTTNFSGGRGGGSASIHVGSVTAQSVKLGGTPSIGSGGLYLNAGYLAVSRLSANFIIVNGGDLDGSGGTIIIGEDHAAAMTVSTGMATNAATMYVGYSSGYTGTFAQSGGVVSVTTNLVVGVSNSTGIATLSGGELYVTNAAHTATLNVLQGSFLMSGGKLVVDVLIATNGGAGSFNHTGGTLICGQIQQSAGTVSALPNLVLDGGASAGVGTGSIGGPGTLYVTNASHTATLNIGNGTFLLSPGGTLVVDTLIITNAGGRFIRNGGTLVMNNPAVLAPDGDADGDGQSNTNEVLAGTDPLDPTSLFETLYAAKTNGTNIQVTWTTEGGHSYVVQMATNTANGPSKFVDLSPVIPVGGSGPGTTNYVHVGATTNRIGYYRVRLVTCSVFKILYAAKTNGTDIQVAWTTEGGHSYVVQVATNTATGPSKFVDLSPVIPVSGSGPGTTNYVHVGAVTNRVGYYRIRLGP